MISKDNILRLANEAFEYWGVRMEVHFDETDVPCMEWGEVHLPPYVLTMSYEEALREIYHEIGHRTIAPRTADEYYLWILIAKQEGIHHPQDFTNVFCDVMIERGNTVGHEFGVCPWAGKYAEGLRKTIAGMHGKLTRPVKLLKNLGRGVLREASGLKPNLKGVAKRCYEILFNDSRSKAERIRDLARLTREIFNDQSVGAGAGNLLIPIPVPRMDFSDEEFARLVTELRSVYGESEVEEMLMRYPKIARRFTVWNAYAKVVPTIREMFGVKENKTTLPISKWRPGMPVKTLDVKASVSKYGKVIPGVTALAKTEITSKKSTGLGSLCVLADVSGSMYGEKIERLVEAVIGLIETCKIHGDYFSLIAFATGLRVAVPPTKDYGRALAGVYELYSGGCTEPEEMLQKAIEFAQTTRKQLTMILSDNISPDDFYTRKWYIQELSKYGPVIFIVFTKESWDGVKRITNDKVKATLVEDPALPFTFKVLEPVVNELSKEVM